MIHNSYSKYGKAHQNPDKIIVHAMSEYFMVDGEKTHAVDFLLGIGLSAHSLIAPNGDIFMCRADHEGAYHARGYNTDSLGIEFLIDGVNTYSSFLEKLKSPYLTDKQLQSGVGVCRQWIKDNDISLITRHSDVSPERKLDPGNGFPWQLFLNKLGI